MIKERGRFVLVGITSAGFGCGVDHQPGENPIPCQVYENLKLLQLFTGIYHNVQKTVRWIQEVVARNEP